MRCRLARPWLIRARQRSARSPTSSEGLYMLAIITLFGFAVSSWTLLPVVLLCGLVLAKPLLGLALIRERQVGVVVKRFAARSLSPGQLIALAGEAGYQA